MSIKDFIHQALDLNRKDLLRQLEGLTAGELAWQPAPHANPIGFIAWHMARVEDGWVQRVFQRQPHLWLSDGWAKRFGMPEEMRDLGWGYSEEQLASFKVPSLDLILGYSEAVRRATLDFLERWDPDGAPVEARAPWGEPIGAQDFFAQLLWELNQHGGQIAYLRGLKRAEIDAEYTGPLAPSSGR